MADLFTLEHDYVRKADMWFGCGAGSLVQTPDGRLWTVVYHNLDGYGVVEGDEPQYIGQDGDGLVQPTHMLRDAYKRDPRDIPVEFLGYVVRVIRRVKDDDTVVNYPVDPAQPGSVDEAA